MTTSKRFLTKLLIVAILISVAPVAASAGTDGDRSFSSVVKHMKSNYRAKQQGFLGFVSFARFLVKVIRPAGVKNFKVTPEAVMVQIMESPKESKAKGGFLFSDKPPG